MRALTYLFVTLCAANTAIASISAAGALEQAFPRPAGRVNDFANVIDSKVEGELDRRLDLLEQQTTSEIAVVTVKSLDGMASTQYANRLFKEWGVGQAKTDNGVLVLVGIDDRDMAIEVGYGLEGVLPDGLAGQVIRENFLPRFKEGDYSDGIRSGVLRLVDIVETHQVLTPEQIAELNRDRESMLPYFIMVPFFGLFVTIGFGMVGIGLRTKTGFPLLFGSFFGGMPLLMSLAFIGRVWLYTLLPWSILMFVAGLVLGGRKTWRDTFRDSGGGSGGSSSGWTMGTSGSQGSSGSSGSSWGGSSSSGGFGGGSSGGGGASGRW